MHLTKNKLVLITNISVCIAYQAVPRTVAFIRGFTENNHVMMNFMVVC